MVAINRPSPGVVANNIETSQIDIAGSAAEILGERALRTRILIRNTDNTNPVYIGPSSSVTSANGFSIVANEVIEVKTTTSIYAITGGPTVGIEILEEFVTTGS